MQACMLVDDSRGTDLFELSSASLEVCAFVGAQRQPLDQRVALQRRKLEHPCCPTRLSSQVVDLLQM